MRLRRTCYRNLKDEPKMLTKNIRTLTFHVTTTVNWYSYVDKLQTYNQPQSCMYEWKRRNDVRVRALLE